MNYAYMFPFEEPWEQDNNLSLSPNILSRHNCVLEVGVIFKCVVPAIPVLRRGAKSPVSLAVGSRIAPIISSSAKKNESRVSVITPRITNT
jgi:hypothetical protein